MYVSHESGRGRISETLSQSSYRGYRCYEWDKGVDNPTEPEHYQSDLIRVCIQNKPTRRTPAGIEITDAHVARVAKRIPRVKRRERKEWNFVGTESSKG